jgi:hypothetical protein
MQRRAEALIKDISQRLHEKMTKYNWVGFYLVDSVDSGFLVVGPASADATPRISTDVNAKPPASRSPTVPAEPLRSCDEPKLTSFACAVSSPF